MNKPHKYAEIIKAWADGAEVEFRSSLGIPWKTASNPNWVNHYEYRVKAKETVVITCAQLINCGGIDIVHVNHPESYTKNLKLTFTDGKLTAAEVIK